MFGHASYTLIEQTCGYLLLQRDGTERCTVVELYGDGQVVNAMPGDAPSGGGRWVARRTDAGIAYVSGLYSRSYARRVFRTLVAEAQDMVDSVSYLG